MTPGEDITLFGFHGNINEPVRGKSEGTISRTATQPIQNRWVVEDKKPNLKLGDKIHYWIFAQNNRLGYEREGLTFQVTRFYQDNQACEESISKFNRDEKLCRNEVIFEDDFASGRINEDVWDVLQYIPTYLEDVIIIIINIVLTHLVLIKSFFSGWRVLLLREQQG